MAPSLSSYDLFLSYNSADHRIVEEVAHKLVDAGLKELFLDRWNLLIGTRWRPMLEKALGSSKAVAIFVGPGEMGSWQQREVDIALDLQSKSANFPVIPVLLPGCEPPLGFLGQLTWVDLRSQTLDVGIAILAKAARREEPGPDLQSHLDSVRACICPYRGLLYFREEDAPFFFGREVPIERLMDEVQRQQFVAVVGASGSGKSSVVRAGLVPKLRRDRDTAWETVILVPTDQPLKALARAFLPLLEPSMGEVDRLVEATKLTEHLRSGTISLYDIVGRVLEKQSGTDRVLIVVDQFEELYTLTPDEEARRRFIDELLAASSLAGSKANVTLTLRGDFVGKALAYRPLSDRLQDAQINLGPMTREELECAMCKPAEKIQLQFEAGLVKRILNDVGDEPGNLPLLEFVLKELWDKRRGRILLNEIYDGIGGLQGAVATKADELFKGLSSAEQKILQRIFLRIVRPSAESGLDTRRRAPLIELPPEGKELVIKLTDERLLVTNQSASGLEQTVEVAHEALISNWSTLRAWVNEDREFLLWRDRLGLLVAEWERAEESDEAVLRGPLLIEAQKWFDRRSQDLSDQEQKFISASREERERLAREEKKRQERELEAARKLVDAQKERAEQAEKAHRLEEERAQEAEKHAKEQERAARAEAERAAEAERVQRLEAERAQEAEKRAKEQKESANKLRRRAFVTAGAAVVALILFVVSVFLWRKSESASAKAEEQAWIAAIQRNAAEEQARIAESRHLAAESSSALTKYPQRSLLLAVEAVKVKQPLHGVRVAADEQSLREALGFIGGLLVGRADGPIRTVAISPDNRWVVTTGNSENAARLWDLRAKDPAANPVVLRGHDGTVTAVAISADNRWVVTGSYDSTARLWDLSAKDPAANPVVLRGHDGPVTAVAISADNRWVVTGGGSDKTAQLWDLSAKRPAVNPVVLRGHDGPVYAVAISLDNHWLVTGSYDSTARLWDLSAKNPAANPVVLRGHDGPVTAVAISPDNRWLATGSDDKTARLWDLNAKNPVANPAVLRGHNGQVYAAAISPDNRWLVTGSYDSTARLWDLSAKDPAADPVVLRGHDGPVYAVAISPDNRWVVTGSYDKTACLWDLRARDPAVNPMVLRGHNGPISAVAISPDNHWLVTGSYDGTARLWDLSAKDPATSSVVLRDHDGPVSAVAISADNRWLVTGSTYKTARLWDLSAKDPAANPALLRGHDGPVRAVAISPDNRWVVTGSDDSTARLWDLSAKDPAASAVVLRGHHAPVSAVTISPDNRWLVTGSYDSTARLWDLSAKDPAASSVVLRGHEGPVYAVAISPDNRWLVTGSSDNTARLWDLSATDPAANPVVLRGHNGRVMAVAISPDNRWLVTGGSDNTARLWLLQMNDLVDLARTIVGRNFFADEWQLYFPGEKYRKTFSDLPGSDDKAFQ